MKLLSAASLLIPLMLLAACDKSDTNKSGKEEDSVSISSTMAKVSEKAHQEIRTGNMSLGDISGKAEGEVTPQGDFLIDGKPVTVTTEQRQLLIKHRELLATIAISGVEIGMQGVNLAQKAVGESLKGIFNGDTDQVEKKIEAEAQKIEVSANLLCEQLPLLLESQQTLAESLPEFKPYATMTKADIDDCHGKVIERK